MTRPDPEAGELIGAVARGDRAAFERLYRLSAPKLFAIALRILRDRGRAEEVLQEAFIRIWRSAASFDGALGGAGAWMTSIVRNAAIDALRRQPPPSISAYEDEDILASISDGSFERLDPAMAQTLHDCLGRLEETPRRLIVLAYCGGYSREELADAEGRPIGTIKTWLHRGLAALKTCLDGDE
ncbi:sigma-70 family RNA polymerase sigma factor [Methylobrevis albus]|uniref:Sigma-70 family RNA polymerase sigma factor n=1 Tax=Methylobrevis albus TaxID=2793297 RepID=A0A931MZF2_9HYPH|nr:sigma-70 family RNA polymerase sigma factor [Methylobrevis albus]MBH0239407.1 sigma-70 family RNA polymerase sigma factor [Methylobrevis albus]